MMPSSETEVLGLSVDTDFETLQSQGRNSAGPDNKLSTSFRLCLTKRYLEVLGIFQQFNSLT